MMVTLNRKGSKANIGTNAGLLRSGSGAKKASLPLRFLSGCLTAIHLWFIVIPLTFSSLKAEDIPVVTASPVSRSLKIIPFVNLTGSSNLDYLETGLPQMILNGMTLPVFLRDFRPPDIVLDPSGEASVQSPYSSPQLAESVIGTTRQKIRLEGNVHRWGPNEGNLVELESGFPVAASINADYLIQAKIRGDRNNPVLELEFYDAVWGKKSVTIINLPARNPYDEATLLRIRRFISSRLPGLGSGRIRVNSEKSGALVFLDEVYLGKTPLNESVAPGTYDLRVSHEECEDETKSVDLNSQQAFRFECRPRQGNATLVVDSDPPGASVFLNVEFLGKTPLKVENLKEGTHRVRISLDKHIDRFKGVELKSGQTSTVSVNMDEGDTEQYFRDPGYVLGDWTHHDLTLGLMIQSLALGGGWAYSSIRANDVRDSIRSQIPSLAITDVPSFSIYQFQQIESNRLDAKAWDNRANLFSGAAIASLTFAGIFLWLGYEHDDKEFGELSLLENHLRSQYSEPGDLSHTELKDGGFYSSGNGNPQFSGFLWDMKGMGPTTSGFGGMQNHGPPIFSNSSKNNEFQHRLGIRLNF